MRYSVLMAILVSMVLSGCGGKFKDCDKEKNPEDKQEQKYEPYTGWKDKNEKDGTYFSFDGKFVGTKYLWSW